MRTALICVLLISVIVASGCVGQGEFKSAVKIVAYFEKTSSTTADLFFSLHDEDNNAVKSDGILNVLIYDIHPDYGGFVIYNKTFTVSVGEKGGISKRAGAVEWQVKTGWTDSKETQPEVEPRSIYFHQAIPINDVPGGITCGESGNYAKAIFTTPEGNVLESYPTQTMCPSR